MGCAPTDGETHRVTIELKGPKSDYEFQAFKTEMVAVLKKHGARIRMITTEKER